MNINDLIADEGLQKHAYKTYKSALHISILKGEEFSRKATMGNDGRGGKKTAYFDPFTR